MADWGAGSPTPVDWDPAESTDWGAGSPTPESWDPEDSTDSGGGSPSLVLIPLDTAGPYRDHGGDLVQLFADWPEGPMRVRLTGADGTVYPPAPDYCYGAVAGQGQVIQPNGARDIVRFALPPVPPGTYDVTVEWGAGYGSSVTAASALRVMRRDRCAAAYRLRLVYGPAFTGTGPRTADVDPPYTGGA